MVADEMKEKNDMPDDFDLSDLDIEDEENESRRAPSGRVFWMFTLALAVIVVAVLGITAYLTGVLPIDGLKIGQPPANPPQAVLPGAGEQQPQPPLQDQVTQAPAGAVTTAMPGREYEQTPVQALASPTFPPVETEAGGTERTATVAALLTQAAAMLTETTEQPQGTETPRHIPTVAVTPLTALPTVMVTPAATALPKTGWADEVGLPMMLVLAAVLILVIIFVRVLRTARSG